MNSNIFAINWLNWGFWLFVATGAIWGGYFIPIQIKQARMAKDFKDKKEVPKEYWKLEQLWKIGGIISMIIVFSIIYFMVFKPI